MQLKEAWFGVLDDMLKLTVDFGHCAVDTVKQCANTVESWVRARKEKKAGEEKENEAE